MLGLGDESVPLRRAFGGVGRSFCRGKRYYLRMMGRGRDDWSVGWVYWRFGEVFSLFSSKCFLFSMCSQYILLFLQVFLSILLSFLLSLV